MSTIEAFAWLFVLLFPPVLTFALGQRAGRKEVGRIALRRLARSLMLNGTPPASAFVIAKTILDTPDDWLPKDPDAPSD